MTYRANCPVRVAFVAGDTGQWKIESVMAVAGDALALAGRLEVIEGEAAVAPTKSVWTLRGTTSNVRYTTRSEFGKLNEVQEGLGRPQTTCAALIPIRKSEAWWALTQDERREIFEEQSHHIAVGLEYVPAIARRLHHSRDLGEPFDFLTWFEYAPEHSNSFEEMVRRLSSSKEWSYEEREVDVRLTRTERLDL